MSDSPHSSKAKAMQLVSTPSTEVLEKPKRRRLTAAYKLRVLQQLDELKGTGEMGSFLRQEGLYHAQVSKWRKLFDEGGEEALEPRRRGRKAKPEALKREQTESERLRRENERLRQELAKAQVIIEVQKKVASLLQTIPESEDT